MRDQLIRSPRSTKIFMFMTVLSRLLFRDKNSSHPLDPNSLCADMPKWPVLKPAPNLLFATTFRILSHICGWHKEMGLNPNHGGIQQQQRQCESWCSDFHPASRAHHAPILTNPVWHFKWSFPLEWLWRVIKNVHEAWMELQKINGHQCQCLSMQDRFLELYPNCKLEEKTLNPCTERTELWEH